MRTVPEDIARYPEQYFFGVLPSSCLYLRHVKGLSLKKIHLKLENDDARKPIYLDDVEALQSDAVMLDGRIIQ